MISIITSLYRTDGYIEKYAKRLEKCAAVLTKCGVCFEVICIANDPTEFEKRITKKLLANPWFKLAEVPRESLYSTWNRGVTIAKGSICTFWNVDDIRFPKALVEGDRIITSGLADIVYFPFIYKRYIRIFNFLFLAKRRVIMPQLFNMEIFIKTMQCGPFFMFSKEIANKIGLFDETYRIAGDYEWCARAAKQGARFERNQTIAGIFTSDGKTLSGSKNPLQATENARVVTTHTQ